jgi:hypothetical protein
MLLSQAAKNNARNEISGSYKEDINANKTTLDQAGKGNRRQLDGSAS